MVDGIYNEAGREGGGMPECFDGSAAICRALVRLSPDGILLATAGGHVLDGNPVACGMFGYSRGELAGMALGEVLSPAGDAFPEIAAGETASAIRISQGSALRRDGSRLPVETYGRAVLVGDVPRLILYVRDQSERHESHRALRESEGKFRSLFEDSPVSLWEEDFSQVKVWFDRQRQDGVVDFEDYFSRHPEAVIHCAGLIRVLDVNRATVEMFGAASKEELLSHLETILTEESLPPFRAELVALAGGAVRFETEGVNQTLAGERRLVNMRATVVPGHEATLSRVVVALTDITERVRAEENLRENEARLQHLAHHDPLTGLPNRALFEDRLQQAMAKARRGCGQVALLFMDLDRFKKVNDSLGHDVGDRLLTAVAARLRNSVRMVDTVARLGGDEFVVVLEGVEEVRDVAVVAQKILQALEPVFHLADHDLYISSSIGISLYPDDGEDLEGMMKCSDMAMYRAKEQGRNNYQFFTRGMNARAYEMLLLEGELRQAVAREELVLHYQPQIELASGKLIGLEALLRWKSPERGLIPPGDFIPLAEETGLIVPIGEWVLQQACAQNLAWQRAGFPAVPVAVNISARQFRQAGLVQTVARVLEESGLAPRYLELEITETMIMDNVEAAIASMAELSRLGVQIAIDDFGSGYSSLGYLKRFPLDKLKIDQTFIRDVTTDANDAAIAASVIALAHGMELGVIAEGVETQEQFLFLRGKGCEQGQGFLFGRPLPAAELGAIFENFG